MERFDARLFREILDAEGGPRPRSQNARSLIFVCPREDCGSKLVIDKRSGSWLCFRCANTNGMRGRAERLLTILLGWTEKEAAARLYGERVVQHRRFIPEPVFEEDEDEVAVEGRLPLVAWEHHMLPLDHPHAERGAAYLEGRGVPVSLAMEYDIRFSPEMRQVIFPVKVDGRLVGWQGRLVIPHVWVDENGEKQESPKSPTMPRMPREQLLMFYDRIQPGTHALLAEGPTDALKAHLVGGNVNSMGKVVSRLQIAALRRKGIKRLYLAQDPDAAEETTKLVREMGAEMEVFRVVPPRGIKDLGEMQMQDVPDLVANAPRIYSWQIFVYFGGRS